MVEKGCHLPPPGRRRYSPATLLLQQWAAGKFRVPVRLVLGADPQDEEGKEGEKTGKEEGEKKKEEEELKEEDKS